VKRYLYILLLIIFVIALNVTNIIFVDESGINAYYQREYARAKRGIRVQDTKRGKRYRRTNVIAGLWGKKHIAVQCYEHATTSAFFEDWFEFELKEVQEWLGQASAASTEIYSHMLYKSKENMADKVNKALSMKDHEKRDDKKQPDSKKKPGGRKRNDSRENEARDSR